MDNLPKYNPMEIDDDVYPIRGINMIEEPKKDCFVCKHAPTISLVALDFVGSINGLAGNVYWFMFEVMFALLYLRHVTSKNELYTTNEKGYVQYKPYGILLAVIFGITVRTLFMMFFFSSIGYVPQGW